MPTSTLYQYNSYDCRTDRFRLYTPDDLREQRAADKQIEREFNRELHEAMRKPRVKLSQQELLRRKHDREKRWRMQNADRIRETRRRYEAERGKLKQAKRSMPNQQRAERQEAI